MAGQFFDTWPWMLTLGTLVGALGTLVGAGGGFILVPVLLLLFPTESPETITAISMAVVFFNAASGTTAYARMRRVDFSSGWRFALAAIPGAFLGAVATNYIPRIWFDRVLGSAMVLVAGFLLARPLINRAHAAALHAEEHGTFRLNHALRARGCGISAVVGFVSSSLGIGGGIIHVPALVYALGYPVHVATATSHFVLACTSAIAVGEHALRGTYSGNMARVVALSIGAVGGAQVGARLSRKVNGPAVLICLAIAMAFAGLRIALTAH